MYKPNGEELMSPLEEMAAREKMSNRKKKADEASPTIDSLRSALYNALYGARSSGSECTITPFAGVYARDPR